MQLLAILHQSLGIICTTCHVTVGTSAADGGVQEKLLQRGISEKGLERREAMDMILGAEGGNTTRYFS